MCETINNTLEQICSQNVVPYYPPIFPHGMDWLTGEYYYQDTIPTWWYVNAAIADSQAIVGEATAMSFLPLELTLNVAGCLQNPSRLVLANRDLWRQITIHQLEVVGQLSLQWRVPMVTICWWGHVFASAGPPYLPEARNPQRSQRHTEDAEVAARNRAEREWADIWGRPYALPAWQDDYEFRAPPHPDHEGQYPDEEAVFWRDALEYYEFSLEEARRMGLRIPQGVLGSPMEGSFRLLYSDSEDSLEDDE